MYADCSTMISQIGPLSLISVSSVDASSLASALNSTPLKYDGTNNFVFSSTNSTVCPLSSLVLYQNGVNYSGSCIYLDTDTIKWKGTYCQEGSFTVKVTSNGPFSQSPWTFETNQFTASLTPNCLSFMTIPTFSATYQHFLEDATPLNDQSLSKTGVFGFNTIDAGLLAACTVQSYTLVEPGPVPFSGTCITFVTPPNEVRYSG